ncbi:hypothetical protein [Ensifer aridi]|uniref:hypothetical protein n=1 Tax=Ensifer aridi TaxID=1708715 RepID=UPI0004239F61|nr:hypothetical protein [Ensifer aridi]
MKISIRNEYIDVTGRKILIVGENKTSGGLKVFTGFQIDRGKGRIGGERHYKSNGREYYGDIGSHLIREADSGMSLNDVQAAILERLIEALDTDIAMPGRIGPKMYGSAMPAPLVSEAELILLEFVDAHETDGMHIRHRNNAIDAGIERRAKCSKERIGRMEEALAWVPRFVWDDEMRIAILAYAEVKARGWDWSRYIETRNRRHSQKKAWVKRTLYRWIEKSLQQIECELAKTSTLLMDTAGLHVAHEEAQSTGKSITSDLHAWMAPDGKPDMRRT